MKLHDSLSRRTRPFRPLRPGRVTVYGCGPTVYDFAHIGNFRAFVTYDLLHRHLRWRGHDVDFVVNFTDVDDKTIQGAAEAGLLLREYTQPFARAFLDDAETLGFDHPETGERLEFSASMPSDMQHVVDALRSSNQIITDSGF